VSHVTSTEPAVVREPVPALMSELATVTDAHVAAAQVTVFVHDAVSKPASAVHSMVALPEKPASHATSTVPPVVREPVPALMSELATLTDAHVAAAQVTVFVHDAVSAPASAVHVMVALPE
jgi:DNA-binding transcriptional regulator PaaX